MLAIELCESACWPTTHGDEATRDVNAPSDQKNIQTEWWTTGRGWDISSMKLSRGSLSAASHYYRFFERPCIPKKARFEVVERTTHPVVRSHKGRQINAAAQHAARDQNTKDHTDTLGIAIARDKKLPQDGLPVSPFSLQPLTGRPNHNLSAPPCKIFCVYLHKRG